MVHQDSLLVTLVKLVDRMPVPPPPTKRGRGRPKFFGLDVPTTVQSQAGDNGSLGSWDDLSWSHFGLGQKDDVGKYLDTAPASAPVFSFTHDGKSWQEGTSSATRASITLQKPVRIAMHARQLIPLETGQQE